MKEAWVGEGVCREASVAQDGVPCARLGNLGRPYQGDAARLPLTSVCARRHDSVAAPRNRNVPPIHRQTTSATRREHITSTASCTSGVASGTGWPVLDSPRLFFRRVGRKLHNGIPTLVLASNPMHDSISCGLYGQGYLHNTRLVPGVAEHSSCQKPLPGYNIRAGLSQGYRRASACLRKPTTYHCD
ncbi:hypothetical protein LY76DRAFT_47677 [Colletotrichum caudatum]|nr:hypothetical protein LY76DRAFT_47677 [Colletotrichum caudatum]